MKKIIATVLILAIALSLSAAAEPLVTLSSAVPCVLYAMEGRTEYDVSELWGEEERIAAFPSLAADSGLVLKDLLSESWIDQGKALWNAASLISSLYDFMLLDGSGTIRITPDISIDEGYASIGIEYDDVSMLYQGGGWTDTAYIDGSAKASALWRTEPLLVLSADADTNLSEKGSVSLSFSLDEEKLDAYLGFSGISRDELRSYAMDVLSYEMPIELISLAVGIDAVSASYSDMIRALDEADMLDILDFIGFVAIASDDARLSDTDPFTMCLIPQISVDGAVLDVDMAKLMKDCIRLMHFAENFQ